jgi:SAM-dependent methyltransferase
MKPQISYEQDYVETEHSHFYNEDYYNARTELALIDYFKDIDLDKKLLDYGCGMGANTSMFKNSICYDISKATIDFCKSKGRIGTNNINDIKDKSMDLVFCCSALEHCKNPFIELVRMNNKLKQGGMLILSIPYREYYNKEFKAGRVKNAHLYAWDYFHIANLLDLAGFEVINWKVKNRAGYNKLLPIRKYNLGIYNFFTKLLANFLEIIDRKGFISDMVIYATKFEDVTNDTN